MLERARGGELVFGDRIGAVADAIEALHFLGFEVGFADLAVAGRVVAAARSPRRASARARRPSGELATSSALTTPSPFASSLAKRLSTHAWYSARLIVPSWLVSILSKNCWRHSAWLPAGAGAVAGACAGAASGGCGRRGDERGKREGGENGLAHGGVLMERPRRPHCTWNARGGGVLTCALQRLRKERLRDRERRRASPLRESGSPSIRALLR